MVRLPIKRSAKKPKVSKRKDYLKRPLNQVGTSDKSIDELLKAKLPGKRQTDWGTEYWETRRNRSDRKGKKI